MEPQPLTLNVDQHRLAAICLNPGAPGEPVILLHGITSAISFWQINPSPYMLAIGPCYSLSLPGHYPAVAPAEFARQTLTSETVLSLLEQGIRQLTGERPATLIGHSTGGFAVLGLAARRPGLARRVLSISGFACGRWTGVLGQQQRAAQQGWLGEAYFKAMFNLLKLHPALYRWAMRLYAADPRAMYAHPDLAEAIQRTHPSYQHLDLDSMLPYFKFMPHIDISAQLSNIQVPTLLVTGDRDPIVPPEQSIQSARRIPGAELAIIPGAGHFPFIERSAQYHACAQDWLARTAPSIQNH